MSLPLFDSWIFMGTDLARARLRAAMDALGVSNKERKRLDKEYQAFRSARTAANVGGN